MQIVKSRSIIVLFLLSIIFCLPLLTNFTYWGQMDWDQFTFWNAVPRDTLLHYHQFPLWNPYVNGGNVLLAHPHSPFLSPMYLFVILFGPVIGLKLEIIFHLFIGLGGMYALGRHLRLSKLASMLTSCIFMFSSIYPLHLTEGHTSWLPMAFFPWVFLFFIKSHIQKKNILYAIAFYALIILAGSIDVLLILTLFLTVYALLSSIQNRPYRPIGILLAIFIGAFFLCALKLFPMIDFLNDFPHKINLKYENYFTQDLLGSLKNIFLNRNQSLLDKQSWTDLVSKYTTIHGWHEYGAYIGIFPLMLFFLGIYSSFKKNWTLFVTGLICLTLALDNTLPINFFKYLQYLPFYSTFQVSPRFILGFIFSVALIAGYGMDFLIHKWNQLWKNRKGGLFKKVPLALFALIIFDLILVNGSIFQNAFVIKPLPLSQQEKFVQKYISMNIFEQGNATNIFGEKISHSSLCPIFWSNQGLLNGYEIVKVPRGDVKVFSEKDYQGEVFLVDDGEVQNYSFSPNRIEAKVFTRDNNILAVNQNFYKGWHAKIDTFPVKAINFRGLIATDIEPGIHSVIFYYLPNSFLFGSASSIASLLLGIYLLRMSRQSKKKQKITFQKIGKIFHHPIFSQYPIYLMLLTLVIASIVHNPPHDRLTPDEAVVYYRETLERNQHHDIQLLKNTLDQQIDHQDWIVRMNIAEVLGEFDDPEIIKKLWGITRLTDRRVVRVSAVEGMCLAEDKKSFPYLKKLLYDYDPFVRLKAAQCFVELLDPANKKILLKAFDSEKSQTNRIMLAIGLAQMGDQNKLDFLLKILSSPEASQENRLLITEYLTDNPISIDYKIIKEIFDNESDPLLRIKLARILGRHEYPYAINYLKQQLNENPDDALKVQAAWALIDQGNKRLKEYAYPCLMDLFKKVEWEQRELIIEALDNYKDYPLIPFYADVLSNDPQPVIREIAAWQLGERKEVEALPVLKKGLYDGTADVRTGTLAAIYKILKANENKQSLFMINGQEKIF